MFNRLRGRFSSAHAIALIALFVALAGGAYAATVAPKNSVNSKSVVDESLLSKDVKNGTLGGVDVKNDSLGGAKVKESTLGTVPNAAKVGGQAPGAFAPSALIHRAQPVVVDSTADATPVTTPTLDTVGPFTATLFCSNAGGGALTGRMLLTSSVAGWSFDSNGPSGDPDDPNLAAGVSEIILTFGPTANRHIGIAHWAATSGPNHIDGLASVDIDPTTSTCRFGYSRFGG
jgi:hypothetical protein